MKTDKQNVVSETMRGMFRRLEARPIPQTIASIVEQLELAEREPLKKRG